MSTLRHCFLFLLVGVAGAALAQPIMDITLVPGQNNDLEVRVRPDGDFDGVFSSISFTIRWSAASGANLGSIDQLPMAQDIVGVTHSGPEQVDGSYRYQVFVGFGFTAISDIPSVLNANTEFTLCTIPVLNAQDVFTIVNDGWTASNNADYYVSLNGLDRTGQIYDQSTGVEQGMNEGDWLSASPSPVVDIATLSIGAGVGRGEVVLQLFDAAGRVVWNSAVAASGGAIREPVDMSGMEAGVYFLRARAHGWERTLRLVKR